MGRLCLLQQPAGGYMKTTFIFSFSIGDMEDITRIAEILDKKGYAETDDEPWEVELAVTAILDSDSDMDILKRSIQEELCEKGIDDGYDVSVIRVWDDNAEDWAEYYGLEGYSLGAMEAVVSNQSYMLSSPENIKGYINENYIGEFNDESDMARHLADEDPDIQALDDRIVNCMDLTEYYSDEMRFDMWHDGPYWFWNN